MTPRHDKFIDEYLICRVGAEAARRAGYSARTARVQASKLLTMPNILAELARRQREIARKTEVTPERIAEELASMAFADGDDPNVRPSDKNRSLELLGKHNAMFTDRLEHAGGVQVTSVERTIVSPKHTDG